jgi:DNA-binding FadR family transcriptional regulator
LLRPIAAGNAFEQTVERLLQVIKLGIVPPGERLPPERELAVRLGVSRVKLREALHELALAGQVEVRRGRAGGTFVRPPAAPGDERSAAAAPTALDVEDVLTSRWVLEVGSVELAAAAPLAADLRSALSGHLDASCTAAEPDYRRLDSRLHIALAELTGSPSLIRDVADARMRVNQLLDRIPLLGPNLAHSNAQHRTIVAAVLRGDSAAARASMIDHLAGTAALLRGFLT